MHDTLKSIGTILSLFLCLGLAWFAGCSPSDAPSLQHLAGYKKAELYDLGGDVTPANLVGTIDVSELTPLLAAATWNRGGPTVHKGEFHLVFDDGTHIRWRAPGRYFLVEGRPGYFVFSESQQESVAAYLTELLNDAIVPWRTEKNAR